MIQGVQHTSWSQVRLSAPHPELRNYQVQSWHPPCPTSKEPIGVNSNPSLTYPFVPIEFESQHLTVLQTLHTQQTAQATFQSIKQASMT